MFRYRSWVKMNLTDIEREQLLSAARSRTVRAADVRRAKLILMLEDGESRDSIMRTLGCDSRFIARWSGRFLSERLAGMYARHRGRAPTQPPAKLEARVLKCTLKHKPADGSTHWSSYKLAAELGDVSVSAVQRIWRKHGIKPQQLERHMVSNDPDFETKAADVIGLYLNPPAHAAVFCVDEKTAIQALDRKDRMLPLSPGRAESHGFEYKRNGTLSLFAAFNTATGKFKRHRMSGFCGGRPILSHLSHKDTIASCWMFSTRRPLFEGQSRMADCPTKSFHGSKKSTWLVHPLLSPSWSKRWERRARSDT
ncbi:Mobile element protein [Candidatus Paraburkholderia kirkii]|nr:Mobile element protein [Candidatus Paraburkholderia kirkii]